MKHESRRQNNDINYLPYAILHQILLHLLIKFVAKTGVASKKCCFQEMETLWIIFLNLDFTTLDCSFNFYTTHLDL